MNTDLTALSGQGEPNGKVYGYAGQSYTDTLTGKIWALPSDANAGTFGWAVKNEGGGGIPDAPSDGQLYGREDGKWIVVGNNVTVPAGRTIFVDDDKGDDATAELFNVAKPFATLQSAAETAFAQFPDAANQFLFAVAPSPGGYTYSLNNLGALSADDNGAINIIGSGPDLTFVEITGAAGAAEFGAASVTVRGDLASFNITGGIGGEFSDGGSVTFVSSTAAPASLTAGSSVEGLMGQVSAVGASRLYAYGYDVTLQNCRWINVSAINAINDKLISGTNSEYPLNPVLQVENGEPASTNNYDSFND